MGVFVTNGEIKKPGAIYSAPKVTLPGSPRPSISTATLKDFPLPTRRSAAPTVLDIEKGAAVYTPSFARISGATPSSLNPKV